MPKGSAMGREVSTTGQHAKAARSVSCQRETFTRILRSATFIQSVHRHVLRPILGRGPTHLRKDMNGARPPPSKVNRSRLCCRMIDDPWSEATKITPHPPGKYTTVKMFVAPHSKVYGKYFVNYMNRGNASRTRGISKDNSSPGHAMEYILGYITRQK